MTITRAFLPLLDLCLPRQCPACEIGYEADTYFCPGCEAEMKPLETVDQCPRCSIPLPTPGGQCPHCHDKGVTFLSRITSLSVFRGPLKSAIHHAKYGKRWSLIEQLTDRLNDRRDLTNWLAEVDALVPVPLHPSRQRTRGFNQAEVIARRIQHHHPKVKVILPIVRVRATKSQANLDSRPKRQKNLEDAFVLTDSKAVHGKHFVLVDDVMTTGATLVSMARTLKTAEPATLSAIVLSVADPKGRQFEVI